MINQHSLQAVHNARLNSRFVAPLLDSYCFAQIPQTIHYLFGAADQPGLPRDTLGPFDHPYDVVVLLIVDGFGWRFVEQYADRSPFLRRFFEHGMVSKLTSQFPSTTAAHVTTIHTGLPASQSGVFEWFYYEPSLDRMIAPLLFSYAGDKGRNTMLADGVDPVTLYPSTSIYQHLREAGVKSYIYQHRDYASSPYSQVVTFGGRLIPFVTGPESLIHLSSHVVAQQDRAYYLLYLDVVDTINHRHGPESAYVAAEIESLLFGLEHFLHQRLTGLQQRVLLMMTADHGHVAISPQKTFYVNREIPKLVPLMRTDRDGRPLAPAGSARDLFLYVQDEQLERAADMLRKQLQGRAEVWRVADLIHRGVFGTPSERLLERLANLVVLPYAGEAVWWWETGRFEQHYYGSHGGLTAEEAHIPLLLLEYGG